MLRVRSKRTRSGTLTYLSLYIILHIRTVRYKVHRLIFPQWIEIEAKLLFFIWHYLRFGAIEMSLLYRIYSYSIFIPMLLVRYIMPMLRHCDRLSRFLSFAHQEVYIRNRSPRTWHNRKITVNPQVTCLVGISNTYTFFGLVKKWINK